MTRPASNRSITTRDGDSWSGNAAGLVDRSDFARLVEPHRRQIKAYCYRMTGSSHDAEDLFQETFLRAWRSFDKLSEQGSLKAWLFQIATRVCIDAARQRQRLRRMLPEMESGPTWEMPSGRPATHAAWIEPYPDSDLDSVADEALGPEARYEGREAIRLAFVAAIQYLPPRQRAVLLLIDVLGWSAAETASLVGGSVASINSALQRARATLAKHYPDGGPPQHALASPEPELLLERYVRAWEAKDLDGFVALLKEDATYTMPPWRQWYSGRDSIRRFFGAVWKQYGRFRLLSTTANGQPAFALYVQDSDGDPWRAHSLQVLSFEGHGIAKLTLFLAPMAAGLFSVFGFPVGWDAR